MPSADKNQIFCIVPTKNRSRLCDMCFTIVIGEGPGFLGVRGRGNKVDEISWYEVFGRDRIAVGYWTSFNITV